MAFVTSRACTSDNLAARSGLVTKYLSGRKPMGAKMASRIESDAFTEIVKFTPAMRTRSRTLQKP